MVADSELVERVLAGDSAAYELVMRRYNRRLFRAARGIVTDDAEAEDVVQEAYLRAYLRLDQFTGPAGFGAWLARITVNEALGRLRRDDRVVFIEDHFKEGRDHDYGDTDFARAMTSPRPSPEKLAARGELGRVIEKAIDGLPGEFRAVFMLRAVEGMSVAETAVSLGIPPATVKTRFHRARRLLKESLADQVVDQLPGVFEFEGARCDRVVAAVMQRLPTRLTPDRPG